MASSSTEDHAALAVWVAAARLPLEQRFRPNGLRGADGIVKPLLPERYDALMAKSGHVRGQVPGAVFTSELPNFEPWSWGELGGLTIVSPRSHVQWHGTGGGPAQREFFIEPEVSDASGVCRRKAGEAPPRLSVRQDSNHSAQEEVVRDVQLP